MLALATRNRCDGWVERREPRHQVLIPVKMRAGGMRVDVCIRDVSTKGVCVSSPAPPVRGTVVELSGACSPIVGRVVWATGSRFGVEVGGRINIASILATRPGTPSIIDTVPKPAYSTRPVPRSHERSRHISARLQYCALALAVASAAGAIAQAAHAKLSSVSVEVASAIDGSG